MIKNNNFLHNKKGKKWFEENRGSENIEKEQIQVKGKENIKQQELKDVFLVNIEATNKLTVVLTSVCVGGGVHVALWLGYLTYDHKVPSSISSDALYHRPRPVISRCSGSFSWSKITVVPIFQKH